MVDERVFRGFHRRLECMLRYLNIHIVNWWHGISARCEYLDVSIIIDSNACYIT